MRIIVGDRLLRMVSRALDLPGTSTERDLEVARRLEPRLDSPGGLRAVQIDPSYWGGPAVEMCAVLPDDHVAQAIRAGDAFRRIPTAALNLSARGGGESPDRGEVGCVWQSDSGDLRLWIRYLGPDGVRAAEARLADAEELDVAGRPGRYLGTGNQGLLVPLSDSTALALIRANLYDPLDRDPRAQAVGLAEDALATMGVR